MQAEVDQWRKRIENLFRQKARNFRKGKIVSPINKTVRIYKGGYQKGKEPDVEFSATEEKLVDSIRSSTCKRRGELERIQFTMAYHARFREAGVGRGNRDKTPDYFVKPIIEKEINKLADIVSDKVANKALSAIKF